MSIGTVAHGPAGPTGHRPFAGSAKGTKDFLSIP